MPDPAWTANVTDWNDGNPSLSTKYNTVPWRDGTENRNPEIEHGPRADTKDCGKCKITELQAWGDYLLAYSACESATTEAEQKNCRRLAWIAYLIAMYDCFQNEGCFGD